MKKLALAVLLTSSTVALADVSIVDNKKTIKVDCAVDKNVNIIGNHATVTLVGTCALVSISGNSATVTGTSEKFYLAGNKNTVNADGADEIATPGNKNTVTWKKGVSKKQPAVSNPGKDNKISQAK
jgi:hypothetical protein